MADSLQTRIDRLESILSRGVLEIREGQSTTTFQNADALRREVARLKGELASSGASDSGSRTTYATFE